MAQVRPFLPAISWAGLLVLLYAIPGGDMPNSGIWDYLSVDKAGHFALFALFSCILIVAFRRQMDSDRLRRRAEGLAIGIGVFIGAILEWMQGFLFEDRTSDLVDFLANLAGVLAGVILFRLIYRK